TLVQSRIKARLPGGGQGGAISGGRGSTTTQFVRTPRLFVPAKNSTLVTDPSTSPATATKGTLAGAVKTSPSTGEVRATKGGTFVAPTPVIKTVALFGQPMI